MKKFFLLLTCVLLSVHFLGADVYVKQKTHTGAFELMGQKQPAKDEINEMWLGTGKMSVIRGDVTMVFDINKKKMWYIFHKTKSYFQTGLPLDTSKFLPPQASQMMSGTKVKVSVTPNNQSKRIGKWNCKGYDVVMNIITPATAMKMKMLSWASTDVPFDWRVFQEKLAPEMWKATMARLSVGDEVVNQFKKMKGFQVGMEMSMDLMGATMRVRSEVMEITTKPAPEGTFGPPEGYEQKDKLSMTDIQNLKQ